MKLEQGAPVRRNLVVLALLGVYCVAAGLALSFGKTLGNSVDMGFHLQTTELLRDHLFVPGSAESFQREMFAYPRWSYRLASPALWVGLSSPNALGLAATFSAATAWLMLLVMARRVSEAVLLMALLCSTTIILFLGAAIGAEIVINYYYPQLVGEPVAIGLVLIGVYLIGRSRLAFTAFAVAAIWVTGQFHLIPALHAAGGLGVVLVVDWLRTPAALRMRAAAWLLALPAMVAALVLNPAFAAQRRLAIVDGGIRFVSPLDIWHVVLAAAALLALSGAIILHRLRRPEPAAGAGPALIFFAAIGSATAAAALAQAAALGWLGEGSPYAVKKHAFAVFTALAFVFPLSAWLASRSWAIAFPPRLGQLLRLLASAGVLAIAYVIRRRAMALGPFTHLTPYDQLRVLIAGATALGLLLAAVLIAWNRRVAPISGAVRLAGPILVAHMAVLQLLFLRPGQIDTPRLSSILEDTAALKARAPGAGGYLFASSEPQPVMNFLVNMAALQMDRAANRNFATMLSVGDVPFPELAPNMITEVGDATYDVAHCRRGPPQGSVVPVDGACIPQAVYDFGVADAGAALLGDGWSVQEQDWTWSDGPRAEINLPLPPSMKAAENPRLIIQTTGYTSPQSTNRVVHLTIEGGTPQTYTFNHGTSGARAFRLEIPAEALRRGMARIVFTIDDPQVPDPKAPRHLGVAVWRMVLYPDAARAADRPERR
ncbi:MAG: hypothetical protein IT546_14065 [Caulobacteraceae bacterium]|nr:hypothetical protein [Caulobacteraceae bacterium]